MQIWSLVDYTLHLTLACWHLLLTGEKWSFCSFPTCISCQVSFLYTMSSSTMTVSLSGDCIATASTKLTSFKAYSHRSKKEAKAKKDKRRRVKTVKDKKWQLSKNIFAFASYFALCEWASILLEGKFFS